MKLRYLILGGTAIVAANYISSRISRAGRHIRSEPIEDPEIIRGYAWVTRLPQFRLLSLLVARRGAKGLDGGRALDLGSGTGQLAIGMARTSPRLAVLGIDISDGMIELASSNARQAGVADRVTFVKSPADMVPYPDASFDLVVSTLSLHHWLDPVAVFNETARILKPGGRFLFVDLRRDVGLAPWLVLWIANHLIVPPALRRAGEPMGSRLAAYTPREVVEMVSRSTLQDWRVTEGPFWLAVSNEWAR